MELYKKVKFNDGFWCIVKLDEEEKAIIGHGFAVSQKYPNDYWQKNHFNTLQGRLDWLKEIDNPAYYEGYFDTELECYYHIKLVEVCKKLDSIQNVLTKDSNLFAGTSLGNANRNHTVHWFGTHLVLGEEDVSCAAGDGIYE